MIPLMADNKYYENFEREDTSLQIYQIDPETGEKVEGTDGTVIMSDEAMGFEGERVMKVPADAAFAISGFDADEYYFRMEFGKLSNLEAGDSFGFSYGGAGEISIGSVSDNDDYFFEGSFSGDWNICNYTLTEEDLESESPSIEVVLYIKDDADEVFFDAIGIGGEKNPYCFATGTSMAFPAAAGAAAVIASRHFSELGSMDADSAERLATLVRSSVRPLPALADKISTGGIIDLAVETEGIDVAEKSPDITDSTLLKEPEKEYFTLTYELNGGSYDGNEDDITEVYEKDTVITIHEAPEREGYTFTYWKGSGYQPGDEYTVMEDHTFTAQWQEDFNPSVTAAPDISEKPVSPTVTGIPDKPASPTGSGSSGQSHSPTGSGSSGQSAITVKAANSANTGSTASSSAKSDNGSKSANVAKTGDENPILLWLVLTVLSLMGVFQAALFRR